MFVSACGGDFTARNGAFASPSYPNSYPANTECVWTIRVSPGNRVQLSFRYGHTFFLKQSWHNFQMIANRAD